MDYNKERLLLLEESEVLFQKYPDRIPILVQLDSRKLKISKHKFLVSDKVSLSSFIEILKKKLIDFNTNDTLNISVTKYKENKKELQQTSVFDVLLKDFYKENVDPSTKMLILTVSRKTAYKSIKSSIGYYLGY